LTSSAPDGSADGIFVTTTSSSWETTETLMMRRKTGAQWTEEKAYYMEDKE
jgi:hypothetical protein